MNSFVKMFEKTLPGEYFKAALSIGTGKHFCPNCKKEYVPAFLSKTAAQEYGKAFEKEPCLRRQREK